MKSCSCISLPRNRDEPVGCNRNPSDTFDDDTRASEMVHNKGGITTLIEVLRCELGRPGRSPSTVTDLGPKRGWMPLHYAAYHNRPAALLHYLRSRQLPDGASDVADPPLCIAVAAGHLNIVEILLAAGANVNTATKADGETPMHLAIKHGRSDLVDTLLLLHGPDLNVRTLSASETPLHYAAARAGSLAVVVSLLKYGANYEAFNANGVTAAEVALQKQNLHAAVAIINAARGDRKKLVKEKDMLLKFVEKAQNRFSANNELIADIFEAGCPSDSTVLVEAIKRDDVGLVEYFLEKGADPDRVTKAGYHPIFVALDFSSVQALAALVKHGANVTLQNPRGLTVLQCALDCALTDNKDAITAIIDILLSNGADPLLKYKDGRTLLHHAVGPGRGLSRVAQKLLKHGVDIDERDNIGNTALHVAAWSRPCTAVLLKHGANARLVNDVGDTPLLHATRTANREQEPDLEQLIKVSSTRDTDSIGKVALHLAAENGLEKTVRLLLQAGADTTSTAEQERTPLHLAVLNHQWHVVPLLATQPGMNTWDTEGNTALHYIVMSIPKALATWKDIALAAAPFCEKGVSRIMRDRSGATPLIQAMKHLPEDAMPVIEVLLSEKASRGSNCIGHEDLEGLDALFNAATLAKPAFVEVLLKSGAPYTFKTWKPNRGPVQPTSDINRQILKLFAEHEWLRRATALQRQSVGAQNDSVLAKVLPVHDLKTLLAMGLDPNALPRSRPTRSLLWVILNHVGLLQAASPRYVHESLRTVLSSGANPNTVSDRTHRRTTPGRNSPQPTLALHPLTHLLEQCPDIDMDFVHFLLDKGTGLGIPSPFYEGRSPLHSAVKANRIDIVDLFLLRKAEVNCKDAQARTPIFLSAEKGSWDSFNLLLRSGGKVDSKDTGGNTLLHAAAVGGNSKIISTLLKAGVKASDANGKGLLPSSHVQESVDEGKKEKITKLLKQAEEQEHRDMLLKKQHAQKCAIQEREEQARKAAEAKNASNAARTNVSAPLLSSRPTPSNAIVESTATTPVHLSKQMVSIRYTPPSPKQQQLKPVTQKLTPSTEKLLPPSQPRADSGLDGQLPSGVDKPLPVLDRGKATFDESGKKEGNDEELANWLAMSRLMDRL